MNRGVNRGIIITTASYGPDSYECAKDKPLTLLDGKNLLALVEKHVRRCRIDLIEARSLRIRDQE
jgi:restriction system protein